MKSWLVNGAWLHHAAAAALAAVLTACGGGGGSAGTPVNGGGGNTPPPAPTLTVSLSATTVTVATPATVKVLVKSAAGTALKGQVVTFESALGLGTFSAPSALTDDNGEALVQVQPKLATSTGADTVVARTKVGEAEVSGSASFQLTATNVALTSFTSDVSTLAAYGQTSLTVQLSGTTASNPVNVVASSTCVANGKATLTPASVTTTTGRAVFTYRDNGCGAVAAVDAVQASVTGTTLIGNLSLALTSPAVSSIAFVSASPDTIFLKGSGYAENSNVKFRVNDASGNGVPERLVEFEPTTLAGGLLVEGVQTKVQKKTDANGEVTVRVNAGTVPTPMRVKATLVGSPISTVSSNLAIAVGLPSQLFFSLSQQTINIEGYDYDGTPNAYTVITSDRMGNPVPEGTAINFVTEGGQIQSSRLTTVVNGLARTTANYLSSQPKPLDGRITVVAYALGEESFLDVNGNNVYDAGEDYQDLGDIFIDRLFNFGGLEKSTVYETTRFDPALGYNPGEDQFAGLSLGGNAACRQPINALLDLRIDIPVKPGSCDPGWGRAYARRAIETVLSRSAPFAVWGYQLPTGFWSELPATFNSKPLSHVARGGAARVQRTTHYNASDAAQRVGLIPFGSTSVHCADQSGAMTFTLADTNPVAFNPMPAGTVVTASGTDGLSVTVTGGTPVPSTAYPSRVGLSYKFDDKQKSGTITVTTRTPLGVGTAFSQFISMDPAPTGSTICP